MCVIDYDKQYREQREAIEAEVKKLKLKEIVAQAAELQRQNDWSGLMGNPMTRLNVLKAAYQKRTGKTFFVPRVVIQ
jgi:hypothetical protein